MEWLWIIPGVLVFVIAAVYIVALKYFQAFFVRVSDMAKYETESYEHMRRAGQSVTVDRILAGRKWLSALEYEDLYIKSYDGLRLHARYYKNGDSKKTIVLVHGFKSFGEHDFSCVFEFYRSLGLNFLLVDQRSHGESEGKYITFGVKERFDIRDWCALLAQREPEHDIILGGISMGCTTVLLAAALPDMTGRVKGIVADCGYITPRGEFAYVTKHSLHMPEFPFLSVCNLICRHRAGFGFSDVSTLDAVRKITVPVLFVHGESDDFVPPENSVKNYEACISEKKTLLTVPGAGHGMSFLTNEPLCRKTLTSFLSDIKGNTAQY